MIHEGIVVSAEAETVAEQVVVPRVSNIIVGELEVLKPVIVELECRDYEFEVVGAYWHNLYAHFGYIHFLLGERQAVERFNYNAYVFLSRAYLSLLPMMWRHFTLPMRLPGRLGICYGYR